MTQVTVEIQTPYGVIYRSGEREWMAQSIQGFEAARSWAAAHYPLNTEIVQPNRLQVEVAGELGWTGFTTVRIYVDGTWVSPATATRTREDSGSFVATWHREYGDEACYLIGREGN